MFKLIFVLKASIFTAIFNYNSTILQFNITIKDTTIYKINLWKIYLYIFNEKIEKIQDVCNCFSLIDMNN